MLTLSSFEEEEEEDEERTFLPLEVDDDDVKATTEAMLPLFSAKMAILS